MRRNEARTIWGLFLALLTLGVVGMGPASSVSESHLTYLATQSKKDKTWLQQQQAWGYLRIKQVKAPMGNKCISVPAELEVRNASNFPKPIASVVISDDFGNIITYEEVFSADLTNGRIPLQLKVCGSEWTWNHPAGTRGVKVNPYRAKDSYGVSLLRWLDETSTSLFSLNYRFVKKTK